jgi:hypothetical protein
MTKELLLHKRKNSHRTNGTFAFALTHKINPSAKTKEPFFATPPNNAL